MTRFGYVALAGRPNVGKSTLLNHLLGRKLSITSRKPQTTRHALLGVETRGDTQITYVDTPGIHARRSRAINRFMVSEALNSLKGVDAIVVLVDARGLKAEDAHVFDILDTVSGTAKHRARKMEGDDDDGLSGAQAEQVPNTETQATETKATKAQATKTEAKEGIDDKQPPQVPIICAINKVDMLADKARLLPLIATIANRLECEAIIPISALKNEGLDTLSREIRTRMPEGEHLFGQDQVTDRPVEFVASEIVREKIMRRVGDELPHRTAVVIENMEYGEKVVTIDATIHVERKSQKAIIIGKGGAMLKSIGETARRDLEFLLGRQCMVRLWVKVDPGWTNSERALARLGYR